MKKVVVLGGGMGGLSAAFELASRGYQVEVYEKLEILGGKARSFRLPKTGVDGRNDLPAEHGFRVFPGWYAHVSDSMKRTPYDGPGRRDGMTVLDRLVKVPYLAYAMNNGAPFYFTTSEPDTLEEWSAEIHAILTHDRLGVPHDDAVFFIKQLLKFLGSCEERRLDVYEKLGWWKFLDADNRSAAFQRVCANGLTRSLVATRPRKSSTYTVALILIQMLNTMMRGDQTDRILDGPTSDTWIDPWVRHMSSELGVQFTAGAEVISVAFEGDKMVSAEIEVGGEKKVLTADQFICALPVEVTRKLLTKEQLATAGLVGPKGDGVDLDALEVAWMNGIMYYTKKPASMVKGHVIYIDSSWSLTSVSQSQFWASDFQPKECGDGTVQDILSAIISEWDSPDAPAVGELSRETIKREAWRQIVAARKDADQGDVSWDDVAFAYLDPDIEDVGTAESIKDTEPLLTNTAGSKEMRPAASTAISNLKLASDYVDTYTNLATMEGANEAGRRAANAILDDTGYDGERAMVTPLKEPAVFDPWKDKDKASFDPARPGEPPISEFVDEIVGNGSSFFVRLVLLGLALEGVALWDRFLSWLVGSRRIKFERHRKRTIAAIDKNSELS